MGGRAEQLPSSLLRARGRARRRRALSLAHGGALSVASASQAAAAAPNARLTPKRGGRAPLRALARGSERLITLFFSRVVLISNDYIETNLKIKDDQGQVRELSKGMITIRGIGCRSLEKCEVESCSVATRLSTVEVVYGFVIRAVEATIGIEVIQGDFDGRITACTTSIKNEVVLYDRELHDAMTGNDKGVLQLMRSVVCVSVKEMLVIVAETRDGKSKRTISFTPTITGSEADVIPVGSASKMRVKVTWSVMNY